MTMMMNGKDKDTSSKQVEQDKSRINSDRKILK